MRADKRKPLDERPLDPLTFQRTGKTPLVCEGKLLAEVSSQTEKGPLSNYWYVLRLARTTEGKYVLGFGYRSTQRDVPHDHAQVLEIVEDVPAALEQYDPIERVVGFPPIPKFEVRQKMLLTDLQSAYYSAVGRLLAQAGIVERV